MNSVQPLLPGLPEEAHASLKPYEDGVARIDSVEATYAGINIYGYAPQTETIVE